MIYHLANCDISGFVVVTVIHHTLLCVVAIRAIRLKKDLAVFFDPFNVNPLNQLISSHGAYEGPSDINRRQKSKGTISRRLFASMWLEAAEQVRFGLTPQNPSF